MESQPKISVIMSVFNAESHLREAVESILNQTFKDFEFIIINDGSADDTAEILFGYAGRDSRLKIITNSRNIGLTRSLNKALKTARGEYIVRQDGDDVSLPERFEKQIEFFRTNPNVKLLGTFALSIDEQGNVLRKEILPVSSEEVKKLLIKKNPFNHSSVAISREVLNRAGGEYNENFETSQDYELWFRILKIADGANLPLFLLKKRYMKGMVSFKKENIQLKNTFFLQKRAIKSGDYPKTAYRYMIRTYLSLKCPLFLKKFLRKHFLKSKIIFSQLYEK